MRRHAITFLVILSASATLGFGCAAPGDDEERTAPGLESVTLPLNIGGLCGGEPCDAVIRGGLGFFDRHPATSASHNDGNGRACADCHMVTDQFQLSPANAEARFQALQAARVHHPNADDPLFRPIDADDFRINGNAASDYTNLRTLGLIRITFPLPANVQLCQPGPPTIPPSCIPTAETFVDVWRAVPTVLNVKLTGPDGQLPEWGLGIPRPPAGPNLRGGYQSDARIDTLQNQALSAFQNHAQITGTPSAGLLNDIASFEKILFSSAGVANLSHAVDVGTTPLPDPDPHLNALEQQGKAVFTRACGQCHGGPGTSTPLPPAPPIPIQRYIDISAVCPRPVDGPLFGGNPASPRWVFPACSPGQAKNTRVYKINRGTDPPLVLPSSDPGRALLTGFVGRGLGPIPGGLPPAADDWNKFDITPLRGISKTAPYFHNNTAPTLDVVLDHYDAFFKFVIALSTPPAVPPGTPLPKLLTTDGVNIDRPFLPSERAALLAYMNKL